MQALVFGLGVALSQFYIFASGVPQPAHYLLMLAILPTVLRIPAFSSTTGNNGLVFRILILYIIFINSIYALIYLNSDFLASSVYTIFGILVFYQTWMICLKSKSSEMLLMHMAGLGLGLLFLLAFLGIGEYRYSSRYNAFFNDPNQMAFWALCISAVLIANRDVAKISKPIILLFCTFVIVKSASRSGLVGALFLIIGFIVSATFDIKEKSSPKKIFVGLFSLILAISFAYVIYYLDMDAVDFLLSRADNTDAAEQADIRGYTRILQFPEYIITGAGQGMDLRFNSFGTEIHSTPAGILFYYGIAGFLLFLMLLFFILRDLKLHEKILFIAPLMYSFSTFGFRTPIFWFYLGGFAFYSSLRRRERPFLTGHAS